MSSFASISNPVAGSPRVLLAKSALWFLWAPVWLLVLWLHPLAAESPALGRAWELTSQMRSREAAGLFLPLAIAGNREAALGAALAHLETPPFTTARLAKVRQQLQVLVDDNRDDETGIRARYLLGRIRQLYDSGDGSADAPEFVALSEDHAAHYLGQLAALKLVLHRLYAPGADRLAAGRLAQAELLEARISDSGLRRDYHLAMGDAYLYFGDQQAPALRHYRAAEALGVPDPAIRATLFVQIGELARLAGKSEVAVAAFRKFLGEFRHDIRGFEVRRRLAIMEKTQ